MGLTVGSAAIEWEWILRGRPWCTHDAAGIKADDDHHLACPTCGAVWWHHGTPPPPRGDRWIPVPSPNAPVLWTPSPDG